jgi:pimeloyl-ACP methyl ester carboxylesterase
MTMTERVARFGPQQGLLGIMSVPRVARVPRTGVILLNSGVIHRVGSNRVYVELARQLAGHGAVALRFDLSGIGDSARRADTMSVRESVQRDVADAVAYLTETQQVQDVVLIGLCSGAFDALAAAVEQPRVTGAFMVDLPGPFRDLSHTARHIATRLLRPESWRNPLRSLWGHSRSLVMDSVAPRTESGTYVIGARGAATREGMAAQLRQLLDRRVRLHFLFTAGLERNYNHPDQFRSTFPEVARHPLLSTDYFPDADHSFAAHALRQRLIDSAVRWTLGAESRDSRRSSA